MKRAVECEVKFKQDGMMHKGTAEISVFEKLVKIEIKTPTGYVIVTVERPLFID